MTTRTLVQRNLGYYWRTNLAVIFGVATAVAVLSGALLVGDSVRASLRDFRLDALGKNRRRRIQRPIFPGTAFERSPRFGAAHRVARDGDA